MWKSIANSKVLHIVHVWLAGLALSGALGYQLSASKPWTRFLFAALVPAALNVVLSRRLPAVTAWIFVRRRMMAVYVLSGLAAEAAWQASHAWNSMTSGWTVITDARWTTLPLVVIAAFAFRQAFGRAAGPRHVGAEWLARRARTNWLLASLILGLPVEPLFAAGYSVAVGLGIGIHFALRDLHYQAAQRRRAAKAADLAAQAIKRNPIPGYPSSRQDQAVATLVEAGVQLLSGPAYLALELLAPLCDDSELDDKTRAKAMVLAAKAHGDMGDIVQSTRALESAARLDPECPVTMAAFLHYEPAASDEPASGDPSQSPVGRALLAPRSASGLADEAVRIVYRVNQTFFQVALGRLYCRRGYLGLAFECLDRAVERDPSSSLARLAMGTYWLARRRRSHDDEFRKDALATAHIHLHMCILLENNENSVIARRAAEAIAEATGAVMHSLPAPKL